MSEDPKSLIEFQFKTIDGLSIRYAVGPPSKGAPILLLSPWPESIYAFLPTWHTFTSLGPVIAMDLPGFGGSEGRPEVLTPEAMGEFIAAALEAFELDSPHVAGPDVGTPALLYAASKQPGLFRSLIIGSGATDHRDISGILDELVNAPSLEPYKDLTGEQFVRGATDNLKRYRLPDFVLQDYIKSYEGERFFESVRFVRDYPQSLPRLAGLLPKITTPCQIIVGRRDPFVPVSNAKGIHAGLPKSKLDVLDCGHFAWEDGADEYGRLSSEWITGGYAQL